MLNAKGLSAIFLATALHYPVHAGPFTYDQLVDFVPPAQAEPVEAPTPPAAAAPRRQPQAESQQQPQPAAEPQQPSLAQTKTPAPAADTPAPARAAMAGGTDHYRLVLGSFSTPDRAHNWALHLRDTFDGSIFEVEQSAGSHYRVVSAQMPRAHLADLESKAKTSGITYWVMAAEP